MSSKVKVAVRVRPFNRREIDLGTKCVVDMDETQTVLFSSASRDKKHTKTFAFDHCFWSMDESNNKYASQEKVYNCLGADVLLNAFEGYNACIFAYGQTGSGKTFTMMGSQNQTGLIPRLCDELFDKISKNEDENITNKVEVSYIEIYNEKVRDLLCPRGNHATLRVREHKILGPYVEGLTKLVVSSFKDIETLMIEGNKSRTVAATNMNTESSRSHAVFNIVLTRNEYDKQTESVGEKVSKLSLVDLAGSERASKSGAEGERLKEGSNINRSLVTLGQVISSLADQSGGKARKALHVPYRDSVLTWLLKDNLGGNSKTVMVATISPAADNYEETLSTLRYADRAKRIVNHAVVNEDPNAKIIRELREEVDRLKRMLQAKIAGKSHIVEPGETTIEIKEMLSESEKLMSECTMTWEQKEKQTEKIQQERHKALEEMGISVQSSGIAVEKSKFYLVNLNADPSMNELLVYYLQVTLQILIVYFQFAQTELMMNEIGSGPLRDSVKALEEQYKAEKQGALDKQRQMYEEKIEELRNQMVPVGRQAMERTSSIGSFSSGYGSSRMSWCEDSRENLIQFERKPLVLKEEVIKANTLVREANQLSEEMGKETEFAVTLQIPTSSLSFGRSRPGFSSEVAIVVKHKSKGTQIWSLEKLANKIYDMRDLYNQCVEENIPFSETDENLDLFFEVECHTLIGVANVFLECLLHDVNHEYAAPIISQQGEMVPVGRQAMERTSSIGSFSSGYGSSRMSWCEDSRENLIQFERKPLVLKEEVIKANTLVREANQLSEEMGKETEFAVTLQIPTSSLSFGRSRPGFSSEVAIVVKHKSKGTQIWSLEKLANKIYDMRDLYNQCVEENIPFSETDENLDLFFEVECHTLIGVANVFLECLLHDVNHEYAAPIISQQGEVCGRLKVEVSRISEKAQKKLAKLSRQEENEDEETSGDEEDDMLVIHDEDDDGDDDELVKGSLMHVEVKVVEAYDLPPALCNYVFCQYKFWNDDNTIVVPPINASISNPGPKTNTMIFEHKQLFDMEVTDEFVEYASEGSLAIEVWGNRMKGFDSQSKVMLNWNVEPQQKGLHDRWSELLRKIHVWVEILEINDQGVYSPVELHIQKDNQTGGVFQLRQGHSRRIVVRVQPVPRAGSLPVVCDIISAVYIGSVCMRTKNQQPLDSYQEKDLSIMREKWSSSLMKRREYLDEQIHSLIDKPDKSASDKERESWMIDQWVCLTEERNAVLVPQHGSGIPGAPPLEGTVPLGMERFNPVLFLDLNDVRSGCIEEGGPAGVDSTLTFENSDNMMELPIINYDQKQVSATVLWDSSIHDSVFLNRVTQSYERVYLILKVIVRLASPIAMDLVLRKRISVKVYKKQSWKDSLLRKIAKDIITRSGVTYELVSHIPRQPGEETEERESLAQMAALAVGEGEEEDESVLRKYSKGISHVESLLALDRLRQEVMVKEKLAAIGKPLRKFASTPNLAAASGDLSFGLSGSGRFDSPESNKLWTSRANNRSDFVLPGSFTDPRPIRQTKEEMLLDLSQLSEPVSSSPNTSGVVLRNSGGSSNSRPSSLLMELETLEEDESTPSPSPLVRRNPASLFDFQEVSQEPSDGTISPLSEDLRERSGSADTLKYEDPLTPTPSGEDLSTPPAESSEMESISREGNLIDLTFENKNNKKQGLGLTLRGLDGPLDDEEDEDETSSLLTRPLEEKEPTKQQLDEREPVDEEQLSGSQGNSNASSREDLLSSFEGDDMNVNSLDSLGDLKMGQVICVGDTKTGRIRYIGPTEFAPGVWIGVELDTPSGKNDGSVSGQRYFACKPRYGSFVRPEKVFPIDSVKRESNAGQKGLKENNSPSQSPVVMRKQTRDNRRKNEWKRRSNILFANNRSDFVLPGSFTDPRPIRQTKEEMLLDLSQLSEPVSSSPNTSGVVLRNSGGSSNSRPSSLLMELETLEEDESTPSPSPLVRRNPASLFDFQEVSQEPSDGTISPLSEDLRERSGSADTLKYEDPLTPTPSGEDLSTPPAESSEMESISREGNLIDLTFENKNNKKQGLGLTLRGLDGPLDDEEDEDETSSLLTRPLEEKEPTKQQLDEREPVDEEQLSGSQGNSNASSREDLLSSFEGDDMNVNSLDSLGDLKMGQVICVGDTKTGRIRYIGPTEFAPGVWIGVELDTPSGKNDGSVSGQRYFACKPRYGSFVRPEKVFPIDSVKRESNAGQKGLKENNSPSQSPVVMRKQTRDNRRKNEWKRRSNILF
ncbi:kinesin-like protein KIF13B [Orbicella faveolata]|uniref:kinesin-like protein KIF13B n=1 Tax=Orbicella faveolata TaxID=48498 RepID=UPI0009E56C33|nr:kinesin-like protein KIF13B [Orbicella faveolata]